MKASDIARAVGGQLTGGSDPELHGVAPLDVATPQEVGILSSARYRRQAAASAAGAVLTTAALAPNAADAAVRIVVADVHRALARLLPLFHAPEPRQPGISSAATIAADAVVGEDCTIEAGAVVGPGCRLGARTHVGALSVLVRDCHVGDDVYLHPHVTLYRGVQVGARTIVHAGARLGVDGFGYVRGERGAEKIPQVGGCRIGADVEIGGNCCIDRGSIGDTVVEDGCKVDNLVHIGHNVRIGAHTVIVAQAGISGSTRIGRGVTIAGQAGINGHIEIGDGATIAAQSGVFGDVAAGARVSGYPARPHAESLRAQAALFRLPRLLQRLRALERRQDADDES